MSQAYRRRPAQKHSQKKKEKCHDFVVPFLGHESPLIMRLNEWVKDPQCCLQKNAQPFSFACLESRSQQARIQKKDTP